MHGICRSCYGIRYQLWELFNDGALISGIRQTGARLTAGNPPVQKDRLPMAKGYAYVDNPQEEIKNNGRR